jgi:ABC-type Fe3+-hydroxamate transport system substrate-binding protein
MTGVVSLVPSVTETLLAWGVTPLACTRFCEQPSLPHVGGTKDPDLDAIVALRPDVVVMDREENRLDDANELIARGVGVHVTHVTDLDGLDAELAALADVVGAPPPPATTVTVRPTWASALVLIWKRPAMALGDDTYGSSLLRAIGVRNVCSIELGRYPVVDERQFADVDLLVLPSEPYPFGARHLGSADLARLAPNAWPVLVDGQDLLWWGSRTVSAADRLAGAMASQHRARPPR